MLFGGSIGVGHATYYFGPVWNTLSSGSNSEALAQVPVVTNCTLTSIYVNMIGAPMPSSGALQFFFRKNGVSVSQLNIGPGANPGVYSVAASVTFGIGDAWCVMVTNGATTPCPAFILTLHFQ
jgi:hypothetical protein